MKQISSAITISQKAQPSKTGTPGGEHGLATPANLEIAAWLSRQAPADIDKAAVSRASLHNVALLVRYENRFPTGPNGEHLPSYPVAVGCEAHGSDEERESALADLMNFMTPAPARSVEGWLAELSVIVAKRRDGEFDEALRLTAYASRLSKFPADVVRHALLERTWQFWPTWAELEQACNAAVGSRRQMIHALRLPARPDEADRMPPTEAEKARVRAMVAEAFPPAADGEI